MDNLSAILALVGVLAILLFFASAFTPKTIFFLKNPTKKKAANVWFGIGIVCIALSYLFMPSDDTPEMTGTPLAYTEIKKEEDVRAAIKRNRLSVMLVVNEDQSKATQDDLLATVKTAAIKYQKESDVPVVTVWLTSQRASNAFGELPLARVTYIPDMKGYSGKQDKGPWDMVMAAERGFTTQELEYMRNWADMRGQFAKADGTGTDDAALDAAISQKMGIAAESLKPHHNVMQ